MAIVGCPLFGSRYLRSATNVQFHARPRFMNHPSWSHITTTIRVITSKMQKFALLLFLDGICFMAMKSKLIDWIPSMSAFALSDPLRPL